MTNSNVSQLCAPDEGQLGTTLLHPLFGLFRRQWPGDDGVEFDLPHGRWIELLRANGFDVEALHEVQAPADAELPVYYDYVTAAWARQWAAEEIWVACKFGRPSSWRQRRRSAARSSPNSASPSRSSHPITRSSAMTRSRRRRQGSLVDGGELPVLGVDTIVRVGDAVLGKASHVGEAEAMLEQLSGREHEVVSGFCLRTRAWEELRVDNDPRRIPCADRTRPRVVPRSRRVGGTCRRVCDPGTRRCARRAHRGRLPERRRAAGGDARARALRAFRGRVWLRLVWRSFGVWRSLVARSVRVGQVPSSNLWHPD